MVVKRFGDGDDRFVGTPFVDSLFGNGGDDVLFGAGADDNIWGGTGKDRLHGGTGSDYVFAEQGRDGIHGDSGADTLIGGADADRLYGGTGDDFLAGGRGRLGFYNDHATDILYGGDGDDTFSGFNQSQDIYHGGKGDDSFAMWNDTAFGGPGDDIAEIDTYFSPEQATNDITLGTGRDWLFFDYYKHDQSTTVVHAFEAGERVSFDFFYTDAYVHDGLWDAMDRDDDGKISAADSGSGDYGGVSFTITVEDGDTILDFDGNTLRLEHFVGLTDSQWL